MEEGKLRIIELDRALDREGKEPAQIASPLRALEIRGRRAEPSEGFPLRLDGLRKAPPRIPERVVSFGRNAERRDGDAANRERDGKCAAEVRRLDKLLLDGSQLSR